ncbi:MAG: glycerol-3-phosphate 1-O-acyltransferase PlsY [Lachnospiraceae bacterium]|nr:glycerol-3-phosphate 1-O-acyltransferase PlsY [Lachnospiraceae bacterium]
MVIDITISLIAGYLLGSVPFALVIGKLFYHTDIRKHGSGNLGGGNAGRVLGKKAGLAVMTLDILKVVLAIGIASNLKHGETAAICSGLAAALGHCFPVFAGFKGGKAVATMYGFLFGMALFSNFTLWIFFLPLLVFLVVLYIWKIIALASISSAVFITGYFLVTGESVPMTAALFLFTVLILVRHRKNIGRMIRGEENRISWM